MHCRFRHMTHAILALLLAGAVWLYTQQAILPDSTQLLISGILLLIGFATSLLHILAPELPRMEKEKSRTPRHYQLWQGILLFGFAAFFMAMGLSSLLNDEAVQNACMISVLALVGSVLTIISERVCICWNDQGVVIQTMLGNIHHFGWEQLTHFSTIRHGAAISFDHQTFAINLNSAQCSYLLQCANDHRQMHNLPLIQWK